DGDVPRRPCMRGPTNLNDERTDKPDHEPDRGPHPRIADHRPFQPAKPADLVDLVCAVDDPEQDAGDDGAGDTGPGGGEQSAHDADPKGLDPDVIWAAAPGCPVCHASP